MNGWQRMEKLDKCFPDGTKVYIKNRLCAAVSIENGLYHISISHPTRDPNYYELKEARYSLVPDEIYMAQIFPPSKDFVNLHTHCFHLWQIPEEHAK